ncbi:fasciclin domain-containing protein [Spirosoma validum]|uniref:Fasciclin domain-containing protein n=1 Tax=Spirosoma validum TaxID=2771355 RepID=A0A927B1D4_9BACT|nr:fasciclin domain-containing protein [Spirosoma validum]MBD2753467.1 fasciclin domain-containing protein [Spirosoma validum]
MSFKHNLFVGRALSLSLTLFIALTVFFAACKSDDPTTPTAQTIMEQINGNSNFTLLRAALVKAGLDGTLGGSGTYTLLAPTNEAFNAFGLTSEAVIALAPADLVKSVLQYHVLTTKLESSAITSTTNTAQPTQFTAVAPGNSVYFTKPVAVTTATASGTTISVNGAYIQQGDVQASNGVIHVINRILLPPIYGNIPNTIGSIPSIYALLAPSAGISFKLLQQAVTRAGIGGALTGTTPITVFAPTDNAFRAATYDSTKIANTAPATLATVLGYHVVSGRVYTPIVSNGASLTNAAGTLTIGKSTTAITVTGRGNTGTASNIIGPDVTATNGVIHIIDRLLIP